MMQTETETHLMKIHTNESNIERQKTEIVSLYCQIQQLQGMKILVEINVLVHRVNVLTKFGKSLNKL
jgi:hypothetical protein